MLLVITSVDSHTFK